MAGAGAAEDGGALAAVADGMAGADGVAGAAGATADAETEAAATGATAAAAAAPPEITGAAGDVGALMPEAAGKTGCTALAPVATDGAASGGARGLPSLIVVPTSLVYNWRAEIEKFTPQLTHVIITGMKPERSKLIQTIPGYDVAITSYPLMRRDYEEYKGMRFRYCILDEAQHIKNPMSQNALSVKCLNAMCRFALTGTPMENRLLELWSIFDFVLPGYLYSAKEFGKRYSDAMAMAPMITAKTVSESGAEPDSDADADAGPYADSDAEAEAEAGPYADADSDADASPDIGSGAGSYADAGSPGGFAGARGPGSGSDGDLSGDSDGYAGATFAENSDGGANGNSNGGRGADSAPRAAHSLSPALAAPAAGRPGIAADAASASRGAVVSALPAAQAGAAATAAPAPEAAAMTPLAELSGQIRPFVLRRLKTDVLKELPDKIDTTMLAAMTAPQKKIYAVYVEKIRNQIASEIAENGFQKSQIVILALLTRLRQICCHPSLFIENYADDSGKLLLLQEVVLDAIDGGHRILLFSQFTGMLAIIRKWAEKEQLRCHYIDGQVKPLERHRRISEFNAGDGELFLLSLKAGGLGVNLTGADMVIHYDPWWNPAAEDQATDRAYRIGQKKTVQVVKLLTAGSIEEKIFSIQERKKRLIDAVIKPGETFLAKLTQADLDEILTWNEY
jgi:superfamily II DNA or RNA helicase